MEEETDAQLVARARADDTEAFRTLVERYQPMAFYLALRLVDKEEVAHDLVQEALLQAYLSLERLRDGTRFKSWLYGIVLNLCRNWRRLHPANEVSLEAEAPLFEHLSADPEALVEERELKQALRSALDFLTPKNQVVAFLFYYQDLSIQEIANRLAISLSTVKNRLYKGRLQLQAHLQKLYPDIVVLPSHQRRRKVMLPLHLLKVFHRRQPFYESQYLFLLDEQRQRAWMPFVSDFKSPTRRMDQLVQQGTTIPEPDTIGLIVQMIHALEGRIEEIVIDELYEDLLYARVRLSSQHGQQMLKARLDDALRLAIHERSPLAIAEAVFERLFLTLTDYGQTQEQQFATLEQLVQETPHLLQPRRAPDNLDFGQGLRGWTFYQRVDQVSYALDTQNTRSGKPVLALNVQGKMVRQHVVILGYNNIRADAYRGKRVRVTAYLRAEGGEQPIFNMSLRGAFPLPAGIATEPNQDIGYHANSEMLRIGDTHAWTPHTLVLDIPANTESISLSFSMRGEGEESIWLDGIELETVEESVPLTGEMYPGLSLLQPFNLDFTYGLQYWQIRGKAVWDYERGIDSSLEGSAFLRSITDEPTSPCSLQQVIRAQRYWGKSVRLIALVKTASASRASLFLRHRLNDGTDVEEIIIGTTDWSEYHLALPVSIGAFSLVFGVTLDGPGQLWLKNVQFEPAEEIF